MVNIIVLVPLIGAGIFHYSYQSHYLVTFECRLRPTNVMLV